MQDQSGELLASKQKQKEVGRMKFCGPVDVSRTQLKCRSLDEHFPSFQYKLVSFPPKIA